MKFFSKIKKEPKVNPISKMLVDSTMERLHALGVTDKGKQAQCTHRLFQLTLAFAKMIDRSKKSGICDIETVSAQYSDDMKASLTKYGVVDTGKQDELLNWFVSVMMGDASVDNERR